jgi:organic radical activating enzyme
MKRTARVIVTYQCDRNCPGCCNSKLFNVPKISNISELRDYEEVVLTGGEPMLFANSLLNFIKKLKRQNRGQKIFLYTAYLRMDEHIKILNKLDGITVTLHAEATEDDIRNLKYMSENLYGEDLDMRLFIDKRVYEKYDLSNICLKTWDVVRKLEWNENYTPADNEDLLLFHLF